MNWEVEYEKSIRTAAQLCSELGWPDSCVEKYQKIIDLYPMQITPYYLSLVDKDDPNDPIAKMCIPSGDEFDASGSFDTSDEGSNTKQEGIQHKYEQTALIMSSNVCAMYCRHCFRRRMVGLSDNELLKQLDDAVKYVRSHPEITNVLISGGDALMNHNSVIENYLQEFCSIDSLDFIRIGSRVPVSFPERIYDDPELLEIFARYAPKKSLYLMTQFNHPREVTAEATRAVKCFTNLGIQVRNQAVLLRGVNDDANTLGQLLRKLTEISVVPYYIFQCRPVSGVKSRFQVPFSKGNEIVEGAKARQNGLGKAVRFVMSHPRGKIEILGPDEHHRFIFKFHQNKFSEDQARIFTIENVGSSAWLDENLLPAAEFD